MISYICNALGKEKGRQLFCELPLGHVEPRHRDGEHQWDPTKFDDEDVDPRVW